MGVPCNCEQTHCHGPADCHKKADQIVITIWGTFDMCVLCAINLPGEYHKPTCNCVRCQKGKAA